MKFVADENMDAPIVERLRQDGHEILYVVEMSPGIDDDTVLDLANRESAILLTGDKDFGELVFRLQRISTGVVLLRISGLLMAAKIEITSTMIREHESELFGAFTVLSPKSLRIRKLE
jgi:predicted nuclease of predicted toxin-antitoxin system